MIWIAFDTDSDTHDGYSARGLITKSSRNGDPAVPGDRPRWDVAYHMSYFYIDAIRDWLADHHTGVAFKWDDFRWYLGFQDSDSDVAMLFKLTWGGQ